MKLCIASDSHGAQGALFRMLEQEQPQALLFLGDGEQDALGASALLGCQALLVAGNCDLMSAQPITRSINLGGVEIFMSHGHKFSVKSQLAQFARATAQAGAMVGLFGHTHSHCDQMLEGVRICNPGSIQRGSYLVAQVENGIFDCTLKGV